MVLLWNELPGPGGNDCFQANHVLQGLLQPLFFFQDDIPDNISDKIFYNNILNSIVLFVKVQFYK